MNKKILFLSVALIIGSTFFFAKNSYANVQEKVTCVFQGSVSAQECHTMNTENSNSLYSGGGCGGTGSCGWVDTNAPDGTQITWGSSCGGSAYTVSDGVDETITFNCTIPTYSIALNPSGTDGTIVSSPAGIICHVINGTKSGYCGAPFSSGTAVTLTATPASGGVFTSWSTSTGDSGGCTGGSPTCTLTMNQNHQLGAVFFSAQQSVADFIVTEVGVKYYSLILNERTEGNHYYAIVKNIGNDLIFIDNSSLGKNYLGIRFEGSSGWSGPYNEAAFYTRKQYEKGDIIKKNQEIEFVSFDTYRVAAGVYTLKATVNPEQTSSSIKRIIEEGDYSNNSLTKTVTIGSSVLAPVVLSPNGGEIFNAPSGNRMEYSYKSLPGKSHNVYLLDESRQTRILIAEGSIGNSGGQNGGAANIGYYDNVVTGSKYKLEVCSNPGTALAVCDKSDSYFTVTIPISEVPVAVVNKLGDGTYELNDGDKVKLDNSLIIVPVYFMSGSGSNEFSNVKFDVYRGATKITTTDFTRVGWDTKTFNVSNSLYDNFNENFVFKVYVESLVQLGANTNITSWQSKITFKSGETTRLEAQKPDTQISEITTNANLLANDKMSQILAELNQLRSIVKEQQTQIKYLSSLLKDVQGISAASQAVLNNFITYGVDANTVKLGAGERAAVINSYKAAFDKLPTTETELADVIKIANGRWPSITNQDAENQAKAQFLKIYKRAADMNGANDNAAVTIMAYGLRQKAENRNLNSEVNGIKIFKAIYGHTPKTTEEWNALQAITYSGATRKAWSGYNPNGN